MALLRAVVRLTAFAAVFGVGLAAGCYSERATPPTYRYPCGTSDDCPKGESCVEGLCEVTCTQATFEDDCPQNGAYLACFNGVCASGCEVGADLCPSGLECIDLGLDVSGGGFFGGGSDAPIGICGRMCDGSATSCPAGEVCLQGFCAVECDPTAADPLCPSGFDCLLGVCVPEGVGPTSVSATEGEADAGEATLEGGTTLMDPDAPVTDDGTAGAHDDEGGAR